MTRTPALDAIARDLRRAQDADVWAVVAAWGKFVVTLNSKIYSGELYATREKAVAGLQRERERAYEERRKSSPEDAAIMARRGMSVRR